jgi:hypothetical protein
MNDQRLPLLGLCALLLLGACGGAKPVASTPPAGDVPPAAPTDKRAEVMRLFMEALEREVAKLHKNNIRLILIGDRSRFDAKLVEAIERAETLTANNTKLTTLLRW